MEVQISRILEKRSRRLGLSQVSDISLESSIRPNNNGSLLNSHSLYSHQIPQKSSIQVKRSNVFLSQAGNEATQLQRTELLSTQIASELLSNVFLKSRVNSTIVKTDEDVGRPSFLRRTQKPSEVPVIITETRQSSIAQNHFQSPHETVQNVLNDIEWHGFDPTM